MWSDVCISPSYLQLCDARGSWIGSMTSSNVIIILFPSFQLDVFTILLISFLMSLFLSPPPPCFHSVFSSFDFTFWKAGWLLLLLLFLIFVKASQKSTPINLSKKSQFPDIFHCDFSLFSRQ